MDKTAQIGEVLKVVRDYAIELTEGTPVPGGTVIVVDSEGTLGQFAFGSADLIARVPVTLEHKFEIGSISKTFTSLLVNALADDGVVDLDQPVTTYLPWFDGGTPSAPITLRHLLSHTAGLALGSDHIPDELAQVWGMRYLARGGELGSQFHYSNLGYMVLGAVIESVTGESVAQQLRKRVFAQMAITDARVGVTHDDHSTMAMGHWPLHDDRPWVSGDPVSHATWFEIACADGNVAASARELGQLARLMLGDGSLDGNRVISESAMNEIVSPCAPTGESVVRWGDSPTVQSSRYGLGVNVEIINGNHCVTHGGGMVGYATFLLADRTSGIGVGVLTNGNGDFPAAQLLARIIHQHVLRVLSGQPQPQLPPSSALVQDWEISDSLTGEFFGSSQGNSDLKLSFTKRDGYVFISSRDVEAHLYRTWTSRFATNHPAFRQFHFQIDNDHWTFGPTVFRRSVQPSQVATASQAALVGHYRCYSPWYPNFRIVFRDGDLFLVAPGGVEAHTEDCKLVEINDGTYRIGEIPWLPERLTVGPTVAGKVITVTRDGCLYSRAFTD